MREKREEVFFVFSEVELWLVVNLFNLYCFPFHRNESFRACSGRGVAFFSFVFLIKKKCRERTERELRKRE